MLRIITLLALIATPVWAETRIPTSQAEISMGFAPLVKQAAPAVVNIYARRIVQQQQSPFGNDPIFGQMFRDFGETRTRVQNSLGSGVILSADGIVVSNYHVVGQASEIRVVLNNRQEYEASVLLGDEESDLAILKLHDAADMPYLNLRPSDTVEVGELVLAIGNPFGVGQTVSSGIVSGLARSGTATGNARGYFLQTDAPINPGNSGGALIDINGQLIGVNTSILTRSGGSNGIGFAIPADLVAQFMAQAQSGEARFQRPWAGVSGQSVDGDLSETLGLTAPGGVVLTELHSESPFRSAGMLPGDAILEVDGLAVNTPPEVLYRMSVRGIGKAADIAFARGGEGRNAKVQMIAPPDRPARQAVTLDDRLPLQGLSVARANPAVIAEYDLAIGIEGIVITDPGPNGARIGLQVGDVLVAVNGRAVEKTSDVPALLGRSGTTSIEALRGGRRVLFRFRG
ncbi:trypsin-like peptidase domain-containing protein [Pseudoprimorskyibacter insulae]|uniref:Periplasmic pH-dependent serine endoprotease DegQ n=1 Tax=Pseudoprimorskyibacter insulae TaxID=1695997 RepID=A0A2R8AP25_9RHOB|nr:trypsin-like peptidase domain-containing protein [Pseudoprimorskyibacter insulae]SPF77783.1 Periplasmic pH-dependent serine endoprotease DegQ [Pseudoprimorskyibacter insulae]